MESEAARLGSEKRMIQYASVMYPELVGIGDTETAKRIADRAKVYPMVENGSTVDADETSDLQ